MNSLLTFLYILTTTSIVFGHHLPRVSLRALRPTQFHVGVSEDRRKADKKLGPFVWEVLLAGGDEAEKKAQGKLDDYLEEEHVNAIKRGTLYYPFNGQHFSRAADSFDLPSVAVKVEHDWSHLSDDQFEAAMIEQGYVFLWGIDGTLKKFQDLPRDIRDMTDDPYRSWAAWLRRKKEYTKIHGFRFQENLLARFLRSPTELALSGTDPDNWKAIRELAIPIVHSKAASHLPGFIPAKSCVQSLVL